MRFIKIEPSEAGGEGGAVPTTSSSTPSQGRHLPDLSSCAVAVDATSRQAGTSSFDCWSPSGAEAAWARSQRSVNLFGKRRLSDSLGEYA